MYSAYYELWVLISRGLGMAPVNEGSHSFTCHPKCLPTSGMNHTCFNSKLQSIATLWLVLISCLTEGKRLRWPWWLGEILRWFASPKTVTRAWQRSGIGAENGVQQAENWVSSSGAVSRRARKPWSGCRARTRRVKEREWRGQRTKLAAQISLKGSWNQYKTNQICSRVLEMAMPVKPDYV